MQELKSLQQHFKSLNDQNSILKQHLITLENDYVFNLELLAKTNAKVDDLERKNEVLGGKLRSLENDSDELQKQQEYNRNLKRRNMELSEQTKTLQNENEMNMTLLEDLNLQVKSLRAELATVTSELEAFKATRDKQSLDLQEVSNK
jgi:chromosome segregation ATPase